MNATYQARMIKPRRKVTARRTAAQVRQLEEQIYNVLQEDRPVSVRHLYYHMTNPRLPEPVEKTDWGYSQVQDRITKMRRAGTIPYGWITDATRRGYHTVTYRNAADALRSWQGHYRGDLWSNAAVYCEVWCESRSIAGVIEGTCKELAVSLYPAGGFTSLTLAYQSAEYINQVTGNGRVPAVVFYIGDYDPAGVLIDLKVQQELERHLHPNVYLDFRRLAITPEQIEEMDLPSKPRNQNDKRAAHLLETVEAEAMPARTLRQLLAREVESFLPPGALEATRAAEESERGFFTRLADAIELAA